MKHTKEKWAYVPHQIENTALVQSGDGRHLAELWTLDKTINCSANAERIVACVNAMEGIEDPITWMETNKEILDGDLKLQANWSQLIEEQRNQIKALTKTVRQMREAQKSYFATRVVGHLQESKRLEQIVDALLSDQWRMEL